MALELSFNILLLFIFTLKLKCEFLAVVLLSL